MKIRIKIPFVTGLIVLISVLSVTLYSILDYRQKTLKSIENYQKEQLQIVKNQLTDNVQSAYNMIDRAYKLQMNSGADLSSLSDPLSDNLKEALNNIGEIRFGDKSSGYIWINALEAPYTVIMHPLFPDMNGTVQVFYISDTRQNVYEAFEQVIKENGTEGFLEYDYYKPGTDEKIPKLSFIRLYKPLNWVIGTGIYIDDIDKVVADRRELLGEQTARMILIFVILSVFLLALSFVILLIFTNNITSSINQVKEKLSRMAVGESLSPKPVKGTDEIAEMNASLNALISGVNRYSDFASEIEKGNFEADFTPLSKSDNLGNALLDMRAGLQKAKDETRLRNLGNEQRNKDSEAYAEFIDLVRKSNENMQEFSYEIIRKLVDYTDMIQAGIYILNNENSEAPYLELSASIAYSRRKYNTRKIPVDEGLIGAVVFEKRTIYIENIPDEYMEIRSGLGDAAPKSLLIVPLLMEDTLTGVIELASLQSIDAMKIEFIEKVSEAIAGSLYASQMNKQSEALKIKYTEVLAQKEALEKELLEKNTEIKQRQSSSTTRRRIRTDRRR